MLFFQFAIIINFLLISVRSQISLSSQPCLNRNNVRGLGRLGRIVGGTNAINGETPYIVSLTRRGGHFCGASILNSNWIVTAGHCVCNGVNQIMKPSQLKGVMGLYKIGDFDREYQIDFDKIIVHPGYGCTKSANDIALMKLYKPISFNDRIQPICISNENNNEERSGNFATVSGWGWTNEDQSIGKRADILQKASVEIWQNEVCQESFRNFVKTQKITNSQMCAGKTTGGIDSCWADSGGPLVDRNNILIGVVSTGVGCARAGLPGIYTRVSQYINWIQDTIRFE